MSIPLPLASLRADLKRELQRLNARDWEGGPYVVLRQSVLMVEHVEATPAVLERLRALPDGAGPVAAWRALEQP